jgi:hypothetical protein
MKQIFQTREEVNEYLTSTPSIECLLCHKRFDSLAGHVSKKHGITLIEYKEKFGLPRTKPLCTELVRNLFRESYHHRKSLGDKSLLLLQERFTDEQLNDYRKKPRHCIPVYERKALSGISELGRKAHKEKREEDKTRMITSIDWGNFLIVLELSKLPLKELVLSPGMPTRKAISIKCKRDCDFKSAYFNIYHRRKIAIRTHKKDIYRDRVLDDVGKGESVSNMARKYCIGETTIRRMLK